jgi:hypothetical protein
MEETMRLKYIGLMMMTIAGFLIAGCGQNPIQEHPTLLEENWGRSFETMKYNQILNAEADKNLDPVDEMDGEAAKATMDGYKAGFTKKKSAGETYNINLGPVSSMGQQK